MGGLDAGDVASRLATEALSEGAPRIASIRAEIEAEGRPGVKLALSDLLGELAQSANDAIWERAGRRKGRMGATLTAAVIAGRALFLGHTGDSRAYLVRGGRPYLLTRDTTVAAMRLREGKITREQYATSPYRNALASALGIAATVDLEFQEIGLSDGDVVVLCSDGVWEHLDDAALARAVVEPPARAAKALVDLAYAAGSDDNLTAVVVRYLGERRPASTASLRDIPLFSAFDEAALRRVAPFLQERSVEPGQVVVREGEPGDELMVLMEGALQVSRRGVALTALTPPQSFGEIALARAGPRAATVTATAPSRVLVMHRDHLNALIQRQPALGAQLVVQLMRQLAEWLVEMTDKVTADREPAEP